MSIEEEVKEHARSVQTQSYSMSVSELVAMYRDSELELHPAFQRFFRWTPEQKSRLIESLVLGIPIPPIFVSEKENSRWDVIDGLQRMSTILEVMGELRDEEGNLKNELPLTRTHYLPSLEGKTWTGEDPVPESAKIRIKRARLDINIVKSGSDEEVKYEVFQRLNTGGARATDQEVRSCLLIMSNPEYFEWIQKLSRYEPFRESLSLTERALEEAFDMELVVRFMVFTQKDPEELQRLDELGSYLNIESVEQARKVDFDYARLESAFKAAFDYLSEITGDNSFRRYDSKKEKYIGPMLVSMYEVLAVGIGKAILNGDKIPDKVDFSEKHKKIWDELGRKDYVGSGVRASTRLPQTIRFGKEWLGN